MLCSRGEYFWCNSDSKYSEFIDLSSTVDVRNVTA